MAFSWHFAWRRRGLGVVSIAIMAGIPKIIDRGSNASAILICIGKKLIGANPITKAEYNALIIAINDISLLFIFTPHLPGFAERL